MAKRILDTPQVTDPGTEGIVGYDYQRDLAVMLCIKMIGDQQTEYVVCEFHDDIVQIYCGGKLELIQVKKAQSKNWTLHNLIAPQKGQNLGILAKLFRTLQVGKDVYGISFWGYGKPGMSKEDGNYSLAELIALLKVPEKRRDDDWANQINKYVDYLAKKLATQGIEDETVKQGVALLDINLGFPHPDAIEGESCQLLAVLLNKLWQVELTTEEITVIYNDIHTRVRKISHKPLQSWEEKSISRLELIEIVLKRVEEFSPSANRKTALTTQEKLTRVNLETITNYAFQKRLNAMILRYETSIEPAEWQYYRTEIDIKCREFRKNSPKLIGPELWQGLIQIFSTLGEKWAKQKNDSRFGYDFVEGIFFDMTGVCEANWMRTNRL